MKLRKTATRSSASAMWTHKGHCFFCGFCVAARRAARLGGVLGTDSGSDVIGEAA